MSLFDFAAEYGMLPKGELVLCALSGGADSIYLLANLLERQEEFGYSLAAAHFDHNLRPTSKRDAAFAAQWCADHGVPFVLGGGDVAAEAGHLAQKSRHADLLAAVALAEDHFLLPNVTVFR